MGLLGLFKSSPSGSTPLRLPSGSFTVDAAGAVIATTLPMDFPTPLFAAIAQPVLGVFRRSAESGTAITQVSVDFAGLRLTARELRGGAIIFLAPKRLATG